CDIAWYDRTHYDQILIAKCALAVAAGFDSNATIKQSRNLILQLVLAASIRDSDTRAPSGKKLGGCYAGFSQSHDEHAFSFYIHRHLPFCHELLETSSEFERRKSKECKHERRNPETHDHLRLRPAD